MCLINIIITVILFMGNAAFADYKAGKAAYDAGDYQTAYNEWLPLAEAGDAEAQHKIGYMYKLGYHVKIDLIESQKWYLKSANTAIGTGGSEFSLSKILLSGDLTKIYINEGLCWLYLSFLKENYYASKMIEELKRKKIPTSLLTAAKNKARKGVCTSHPLL